MAFQVTTAPAKEPITTAEAKAHLRVDHSHDDAYIATLIQASRELVEAHTWRTLINTTYTMTLDCFPDGDILLPRPPLSSVTSITYLDEDSASQTWAASNYIVDTQSEPGRIARAEDVVYPTTDERINTVTIVYIGGYGSTRADVPARFKHAMKLLIRQWYDVRMAVIDASVNEVPYSVESLLSSVRAKDDRVLEFV